VDERRDAGFAHYLDERKRPADVDVVVRERALFRFADDFQARAMNDGGDRVIVKRRAQRHHVAHVGVDARDRATRERLEARPHRRRAVRVVVQDHRRVAGLRQFDDDVRADVAGAPGHEYGFSHGRDATRGRKLEDRKTKPGARPGVGCAVG
jgi:hypothetical protein